MILGSDSEMCDILSIYESLQSLPSSCILILVNPALCSCRGGVRLKEVATCNRGLRMPEWGLSRRHSRGCGQSGQLTVGIPWPERNGEKTGRENAPLYSTLRRI
jgi:hypothetical protein